MFQDDRTVTMGNKDIIIDKDQVKRHKNKLGKNMHVKVYLGERQITRMFVDSR